MSETEVGPADSVAPGTVTGAGRWAVGNVEEEYFAVSRVCRHLYADLANGSIDSKGCLVCPWHGSRYDTKTGRMVRGPQGIYAKIPGLSQSFVALTKLWPLKRGRVSKRGETLYVE
jgi:nitrite reductase/ring-hydroxylating ferredoxin subunit